LGISALLSRIGEAAARNRYAVLIAIANLTQRRLRLIVALAGTAVPIILLMMQMAFLSGARTQVTQFYDLFDFDLALISSDYQFLIESGSIDRVRLTQAAALPEVVGTFAVNIGNSDWTNRANDRRSTALVFGLDETPEFFRDASLREGMANMRTNRAVLIDAYSSPDYGALNPGTIGTLSESEVDIAGEVRLGLFFYADGSAIVRNTDFPRYDRTNPLLIDIGLIRVADGADAAEVAERLSASLPADVRVLTRNQLISQERAFFITTKPIGIMLQISMWIAFLVGSVILLQVISTDIVNRLKEFATLKAMGFGPGFVFGVGLFQSLLLAGGAFLIALVATTLILAVVQATTHLPAGVTPLLAIATLAIVLTMTVLSVVSVVRRIAKADPAELY
jgi:putative ABC transport system permease protein